MAWLVTASFVAAWSGCGQSDGETCQLDNDCQSGLKCCMVATAARGQCYDPELAACMPSQPATDAGSRDASTKDASEPGEDAGE